MKETTNRRILIVDDNAAIHADFRKVLSEGPAEATPGLDDMEAALFGSSQAKADTGTACYELESAFQGQEALEKVRAARAAGKPFAMAFVDVRMPPGWDGVETLTHLWQADPDLQAVICTAYSDYTWGETIERLGRSDRLLILKKPFDPVEACQIACALVEKWNVTQRERARLAEVRRAEQEARAYAASLETVNRALETTLATAEQSSRTKSEFLLNVTNELLRPMATLLGDAMALESRVHDQEAWLKLVETITRDGGALRTLLDDIVDLTHVEASELEVEIGLCEPFTLVCDTARKVREHLRLAPENLVVECATPVPARIESDCGRLERILEHLIENALERDPGGSVRVLISLENSPNWREPMLRIEVVDRGPQIPRDQVGRLFEPFQVVGDHSMGLSLARRVAHLLGGDLRVESDAELGTRFCLTLRTGALDGIALLERGA